MFMRWTLSQKRAEGQNNHIRALKQAATTPMAPAIRERMLRIPPRNVEEKAMTTPIIPETMATAAKNKPPIAPVAKLRSAAIIAINEKMLNLAGRGTSPSIPGI
jgi:hypothetical protein